MPQTSPLFGLRSMVTSAAGGIGEAIARTFAKQGADVLAVDLPGSGIETSYARVKNITVMAADGDPESVSAAAVTERLGGLDILVNNHASRVDEAAAGEGTVTSERLERMLEGILVTSEEMLPLLKRSPGGRIINIGCLQSSFRSHGDERRAEARHGMAKLTADLAAELGGFGITVNYIQPGAVMTPAARRIFDADKPFRDRCIRNSAAGRLGEPVEVAKVAAFLASDAAVFVSGTGIAVDGGWSRETE